MAVYLVIIDPADGAEKVKNKLKRNYPDHYEYHNTDGLVLIRTDEIAERVSENLGFDGESEENTGSVIKINASYSGYTHRGLWQWLDKKDG